MNKQHYHQHVEAALKTYRTQQAKTCSERSVATALTSQPPAANVAWLSHATLTRRRVRLTTKLLTMWRKRK